MHLVSTSNVPPIPEGIPYHGQWTVLIESTATRLYAGDFHELEEKTRRHLIVNNQPVPANLAAWIGEQICAQLTKPWGGCATTSEPRTGITYSDVKNWLTVMLAFAKGREFVPQEQAEARAAVCAQCPLNVTIQGCAGCKGIAEMVTSLGGRETSRDGALASCQVCGCFNAASVHYPLEVLEAASHDGEWPSWCWHSTEKSGAGI